MTVANIQSGIWANVRDWVFDLDNTLYPAPQLYDLIGEKMTAYVMRVVDVDAAEAERLRDHYHLEYGATVVGLRERHGVDAVDFMREVHDVPTNVVHPDPELDTLIAALPGRKIVFTNGGGGHAERVVAQIGIAHHFEHLFDLESAGFVPKPHRGAYERLVSECGVDPTRAVLFEDTLRNLEPAHDMGFATVLVGAVHPEPRPPYVDFWSAELKPFLRDLLVA
ncbi:pyridoxal-5'-phosphate phosphatase alphaproteobacterial type [alpha proteobacterium U9-1i]|nr:pyridoxal-5'-phosphate phosphatase alphaproteobacterial type [alpha proteobacterium U9-1i]